MHDNEKLQEMYGAMSVENIGFKSETSVANIDLFRELQLLRLSGIEWLEHVTCDGDDIKLDGKDIKFHVVAGKFQLHVELGGSKKNKKSIEIKGRDKTSIVLKWLMQSEHEVVLMSEADWIQLLIVDLSMKFSINRDGFCSISSYDATKAYYKQEKSTRFGMKKSGEELIDKLYMQYLSKRESAYNEIDSRSRTEYDNGVIEQAIQVLEEYEIDCSGLVVNQD